MSRRPARQKRVWIFDLDNTLHDAVPHIFPHINRSMNRYLMERLRLSEEEANRLRVHYWKRYGATLLGMMHHHGTSPHDFLYHTHQFPQLASMIHAEAGLRSMLRRLPGRKIIFSNAPATYAKAVLKLLKIAPHFDAIYTIESTRFRPKPDILGFRRILRAYGAAPARCVMVEDTLENLVTAKRLGMRTVWIAPRRARPACVDLRVGSVAELMRRAWAV